MVPVIGVSIRTAIEMAKVKWFLKEAAHTKVIGAMVEWRVEDA